MKTDKKLQVIDADWASAEHTVIMFNDHSIRVFDLKLTKSYSSISNYEFDGTLFHYLLVINININDTIYILVDVS